MDMFKMIKEAAAMRSKLNEMDKSLKAKVIEVEHNGVKVKINAKSDILGLTLSPELLKQEAGKVESIILSALQQAMKRSRDAMAEEAKKLTGGMNIPGLM